MIFLRALRPLVHYHIDNLRDHVARALDDDGVADADVAPLAQHLALAANPLDVVLVVQRHVLHDDAADTDGFELADRRQRAGAADLDFDVLEHGRGALGRKLVRDRPARRTRDEAEAFLPIEPVHLVDHAVDVIVEMRALRFDLPMKRKQFLHRAADLRQRIGLEAAMLEPLDHARLRISRHVAHLAPGIGEEAERARGGNRRILLAQRTGGRIARIGEDRLARLFLPLVKLQKGGLGHIDLATHLADRRNVAAFQFVRHVVQRADIGGDILAFRAVSAGRGGDKFTVLVTQ